MTDTFTWKAEIESSGEGTLTAYEVKFGEGYSQTYSDGINNDVQKWNVAISGREAEVKPALDFIRARHGSVAFYFRAPLSGIGLYKCAKYNVSDEGGGYFRLTMEFNQVFAPQ